MLRQYIRSILYETLNKNSSIGTPKWLEEILEDISLTLSKHPRLKSLVGLHVLKKVNQMRNAPTKKKHYEKVSWNQVDLTPATIPDDNFPNIDEEGVLFVDKNTGLKVVKEDDGRLFREVPNPEGANQIKDLAELSAMLEDAAGRIADALESGELNITKPERLAAVDLVNASDDLEKIALMLLTVDKKELFKTMVNQLKNRPEYRRNQIKSVN